MRVCAEATSRWSGESGWADIWRSCSSSAELSAGDNINVRKSEFVLPSGNKLDVINGHDESLNSTHLSDLGLLGHFGFSSRLLPVDLVPVDPTSELIGQPAPQKQFSSQNEKAQTGASGDGGH